MPQMITPEALLQSVAQGTIQQLASMPTSIGRSFSSIDLLRQIVSDRLELAGNHLRTGDSMAQLAAYRSSISRYYYAMYHGARAICFGYHKGDDYQRHSVLPNNLPSAFPDIARWASELNGARLVRNMADYDIYPRAMSDWENDSVTLSVTASEFLAECENFAMSAGLV